MMPRNGNRHERRMASESCSACKLRLGALSENGVSAWRYQRDHPARWKRIGGRPRITLARDRRPPKLDGVSFYRIMRFKIDLFGAKATIVQIDRL